MPGTDARRHSPGNRTLPVRSRHRGIELQQGIELDRPALAVDRRSGKERETLHQMGAGQELDLTEFRGLLLPASEAPRACWSRH